MNMTFSVIMYSKLLMAVTILMLASCAMTDEELRIECIKLVDEDVKKHGLPDFRGDVPVIVKTGGGCGRKAGSAESGTQKTCPGWRPRWRVTGHFKVHHPLLCQDSCPWCSAVNPLEPCTGTVSPYLRGTTSPSSPRSSAQSQTTPSPSPPSSVPGSGGR
jgi:hypothetical protein